VKDQIYIWIKQNENLFTADTTELILTAQNVLKSHPYLAKFDQTSTDYADPFIIALAIIKNDQGYKLKS
jgi:hypothetical protein